MTETVGIVIAELLAGLMWGHMTRKRWGYWESVFLGLPLYWSIPIAAHFIFKP